jgi:predicted helicase
MHVLFFLFFFPVKVADTHGIVYTPQEIVDFMCASVEEVLRTEFDKGLGDPGVTILDPCTGTGNFIVNLMRRIPKRDLPRAYREQLFANEVMLLPYYIASMNIEHEFLELTGGYEPFEGLCFVDTLGLAEEDQRLMSFMSEKNSERVERQKKKPITVIIGNPPYNAHQLCENDNNRNRTYDLIDSRVKATYGADSRATLKAALGDAYVKFFRYAVDRLGTGDGIICYVSNNSFTEQNAFDGMRKHLHDDFTCLYHLDLHGNVRHNPAHSGTAYNVFGIQVGVGITIAVRSRKHICHNVLYAEVAESKRRHEKLQSLVELKNIGAVKWAEVCPDKHNNWLNLGGSAEFLTGVAIGSKESKAGRLDETNTLLSLRWV